jgi:hypothetical protein
MPDANEYLTKGGEAFEEKNYIDRPHVQNKVQTICLKKGLLEAQDSYVIKTAEGTDFLKVEKVGANKRVTSADGKESYAMIINNIRYSEINGDDSTINAPHTYIYTYKPYLENQPASEIADSGKPLFLWARIQSATEKSKKFSVSIAEHAGADGSKLALFGGERYFGTKRPDGNVLMTGLKGRGVVHEVPADFTFECQDCWRVAIGPMIDPVLVVCTLIYNDRSESPPAGQ